MAKHRVYFNFEVTGYMDIEYLKEGEDPVQEFKTFQFEDVMFNTRDDCHSTLVSTRVESLDPPLIQLAGEAE